MMMMKRNKPISILKNIKNKVIKKISNKYFVFDSHTTLSDTLLKYCINTYKYKKKQFND